MSEAQNNACSDASKEPTESANDSQEYLEPPTQSPQNPVEQSPPAVCQIPQHPQDNQKDDNANTKESIAETNNNEAGTILQLQQEIQKRTSERDDFRKKLEETERKLNAALAIVSPNNLTNGVGSDDGNLRRELDDLKSNLAQTKLVLDDRERRVVSQENQILALIKQVSSLKEVVAITKDMLNIRNMEVKHLQDDVDKMESRITAERDRHNAMLDKMDAAVRLNADLKKEYQTQLQLFQDLRGKYEEKVTLLSEENKALETAVQAQPAQ
ncbi:uncharacterized protein LOC131664861 [Phymastichus coffea]|uniref:uncharacterized protein LOC131664861 n=1 Tax=Phymastichus coffea TaxID=108790 RepID=UPI00273BD8B6|nr:uncharacterized protein LOC131664861 [Phymastichus coffea]